MKKTLLMAAVLTGLVATAGAASADERGARPDFATLDANGDGQLTQDELQAQAASRFAAADTNGDGALSAEEMAAAADARAAERVTRMIARLDSNGDGLIQADEMPQRDGDRAARMFDRVDADDDGAISAEEYEAVKERRGGRRHGGRGGDKDNG